MRALGVEDETSELDGVQREKRVLQEESRFHIFGWLVG